MKNNQEPARSNKPRSLSHQRQRIGAVVAGATLLGLGAGFAGGYVAGSDGKVPEAVGTCVGPVTPDEIEGGISKLQDTLGTSKVKVESQTGADIESEAAKNLRERERLITSDMNDLSVPVLLEGDTFTAKDVAQGTCAVQPGAQFTEAANTGRKDT